MSGDESPRGVVDWQGSTADRRLGATVVRLDPALTAPAPAPNKIR